MGGGVIMVQKNRRAKRTHYRNYVNKKIMMNAIENVYKKQQK